MFASPGDTAFFVGSFPIYYYGIIMAIALTVGVLFAAFVTKKYYPELNPDFFEIIVNILGKIF